MVLAVTVAMLVVLYGGPILLLAVGRRRQLRRVWLSGLVALVFAVLALFINSNTDHFGSGLEAAFALAALVEVGSGLREWSDHWHERGPARTRQRGSTTS